MSITLGDAVLYISGDDKQLEQDLRGAQQKIESSIRETLANAGQNITRWGQTLSLGVTAPLVGFGLTAAREFGDFNAEIERAGAFVNAGEEDMVNFRKAAIDAARGTQFAFRDTAAALGAFVGGEIDAQTASRELGNVVDLALIGKLSNLQDAVNLGSLALTVFKDDQMELINVGDLLAHVASNVTTETDKWANSIVNSAGAAKSAGLTYKDLNVLMSAMVLGGADVSLTATAINSALSAIQAPGPQAAKTLKEVGLNVTGLQQALAGGPIKLLDYLQQGFQIANEKGQGFAFLSKVLGDQAAPEFALALGLTYDELVELGEGFDDIEGKGAAMVDRIRDSISPLDQLKQTFSEIAITHGPAVSSIIELIADKAGMFLGWLQKLTPEQLNMAVSLGALAAAAGPALLVLGSLVSAVAALGLPITLLIGLAALLGAAWVNNWGGIQEKTQAVIDFLAPKIEGFIQGIRDWWAEHGDSIIAKAQAIWDGVKDKFEYFKEQFTTLFEAFKLAQEGDWEGFGKKIREIWDRMWDKLKTTTSENLNKIKEWFQNVDWAAVGKAILDGIASGVTNGARALADAVVAAASAAYQAVKGFIGFESPAKLFVPMGASMPDGLVEGIAGRTDHLQKAVQGMLGNVIPGNTGFQIPGLVEALRGLRKTGPFAPQVTVNGNQDPNELVAVLNYYNQLQQLQAVG